MRRYKIAVVLFSKNLAIIFFLFFFFGSRPHLFGCSLAEHKWQLKKTIEIPLDGPILPISEFLCLAKSPTASSSPVIWVLKQPQSAFLPLAFLPIANSIGKISQERPWYPIDQDYARNFLNFSPGSFTQPFLLFGTDKAKLRLGLFGDENSGNMCQELVIIQESRARFVSVGEPRQWADEHLSRISINITFSTTPFPGEILALAVIIDNNLQIFSIENTEKIQNLIDQGVLLQRRDQGISSSMPGHPSFPGDQMPSADKFFSNSGISLPVSGGQ